MKKLWISWPVLDMALIYRASFVSSRLKDTLLTHLEIHCTFIALFLVFEVCGYIHHFHVDLRACLHGVGDPGREGLVSFIFTLWGTQNKINLPTRPGSPTPCKQGLKCILFTPTILYNHCFYWVLQSSQEKSKTMVMQNFGDKQGALWSM